MQTLRFGAAVLIASALPFIAYAQSSYGTSNVQSLYAELAALQQQIQTMTGSNGATTTSPFPTQSTSSAPAGLCPDLSRTLSLGAAGPDVAGLQSYLSQQGVFNGIATGYFGTLTQAAVAAWQEKNSIVSGGDAGSTGLGVVGPKTRAAMDASCVPGAGGSTPSQCLAVLPPQSECPTGWQPVADSKGCTAYYQCVISLPTGAPSSASGASGSTTTCPVVQKPACTGQVTPFQTNGSGCVIAYQCTF